MRFNVINDSSELEHFSQKFKILSGVNLPLDYYEGSRVVAAYDDDGTMLGGWVLRLTPPFRSFNLIPSDSPSIKEFMAKKDADNSAELNGVWVDGRIATTKETFAFWRAVLRDTIATKKQYIIFGYPKTKQGLHNFYQRLNPEIIFEGTTTTGIPACVVFLTPAKIRMFYFKQAPWLIRRHFNLIKRSIRPVS